MRHGAVFRDGTVLLDGIVVAQGTSKVPPHPADLVHVTSQVTTGTSGHESRDSLRAIVRVFDRDSVGNSRLIRDLAEKDRQAFYTDAVAILADPDDSRGSQFLMATLAENDLLMPAICSLTLTREQSVALARAAARGGQMVDVAMARYLVENTQSIGNGACPPELQRLIDVLSEVSDGNRILPSLMALTRLPNPYLQSKAVLMIGRINRNVKWIQSRLAEPDSRIRANAVEALWGVDTEEARRLLRAAVRDADNRVAGNALIGLYRLGDSWTIPEIVAMGSHDSRRFRATAAWVMGETGDPRFVRVLARMIGEPNGVVRTPAFTALNQIRAATAQARQAGLWRVVAGVQPGRRGSRELQVEVCFENRAEPIRLVPTNFVLSEDEEIVMNYSVEERVAPSALAIASLFPRSTEPRNTPFHKGVLRALTWKRPSDLWSAVPYLPVAGQEITATLLAQSIGFSEDPATQDDAPLLFTAESGLVSEAFEKVPTKTNCAHLWSTIRRSVQLDAWPSRGQRHIIVYSQSETNPPVSYPELASTAINAHVSVHAISLVPNSALEALCQTTKGSFQSAASPEEVPGYVEKICLKLLARYTIRYQPGETAAASIGIRVQSPEGWGETSIRIPG